MRPTLLPYALALAFASTPLHAADAAAPAAFAPPAKLEPAHEPAAPAAGYHVLRRLALGGDGGWDYLSADGRARRLYVSRSDHVLVVDTASGKEVGAIRDTPGVHGIAVAAALGRGYTSNGRDSSVTVFDLASLAPTGRIAVGDGPDAIVYEPAAARVFTFNGRGHDASVIDAATLRVLAAIPLGGKPESAVVDGSGQVYVDIEDTNELVAIDARRMSVRARWPLPGCDEPTGLAIDAARRRLFVGCGNQFMVVVDADGGQVIARLPTGKGTDANGFDPGTGLAFSSNGEGTLTLIHEDAPNAFHVAGSVATQRGARTMALDLETHHVFLVTADFGPTPPATPEHPRPRPPIIPGSFVILEVGP